ncbi:MAG: glycine/sarcosine/betaine reductase complex component C subunit alpha [Bacillota bacterium]
MSAPGIRAELGRVFSELAGVLETATPRRIRVGVTTLGSELGSEELVRGALEVRDPDLEVVLIGPGQHGAVRTVEVQHETEAHAVLDQLLDDGKLDAGVTLHYNFPVGVATVGRAVTPGRGRQLFLATTTGTAAMDRAGAMVRNAILGMAAAKAAGVQEPSVGILNLDGARQAERALRRLQHHGYRLHWATSLRSDRSPILRGNDVLAGTADVLVTDSLTGNVLMKMLSAFTTGGEYEVTGYGYGPGVGEGYHRIVCILSRASGAPVVSNAIRYARDLVLGDLLGMARAEFTRAQAAGLQEVLAGLCRVEQPPTTPAPVAKPVTQEIAGIDVLELEDATARLRETGIYAATGMGCTGPVILVAPEDVDRAVSALRASGYL